MIDDILGTRTVVELHLAAWETIDNNLLAAWKSGKDFTINMGIVCCSIRDKDMLYEIYDDIYLVARGIKKLKIK